MVQKFNMRSEDKKNQRKEDILDAFEALIAKYSVDKTTMQEIADSVGISVGTLYNEFADKEALIDALVDRLEISLVKKINTIKFTSNAPDEQLEQFLMTVIDLAEDLIRDNRSLADYIISGSQTFRYVGKKIHQGIGRAGLTIGDTIRSIIESGVDQGVFEVENMEEDASAITLAFTTYTVARLLTDQKQDRVSRKSWMIWFRLLSRGLMKRPV